jgi:hypothetical protein
LSARRLAPAVLALTLAVPAVAQAGLPHPSSNAIVLGKSIGGATIGHSFASAKSSWGSGGVCTGARAFSQCSYLASKTKSLGQGSFSAENGKIVSVNVSAGQTSTGKLIIPASLKPLKTSKGIGLGSTVSQIKSKYPHAGHNQQFNYYILGPGKHATTFSLLKGKVSSINVNNGQQG